MKWDTLYSSRIETMAHSDVAAMLKMAERPEIISFAGGASRSGGLSSGGNQRNLRGGADRNGANSSGLRTHPRPNSIQGMAGGLYDPVGEAVNSGGMPGDNGRHRRIGSDL